MDAKNILDTIPREGFLKIHGQVKKDLSGAQKTALIRRGNEFFNNGDFDTAKRIFMTTGYSDGLIRMGMHYEKNDEPLEALRMYCMAPAPDRKAALIEKCAAVIRDWIQDSLK